MDKKHPWSELASQKDLEIKYKVQMATERCCTCVAYIDAREVFDKLDAVVGPNNWKSSFFQLGDQVFCELSLYDTDKKEWISKCDIGTPSQADAEKGEVSDSLKRAAVQFGVGRFLYSMDMMYTKSIKGPRDRFVPADDNGKRIYNLTEHFKKLKAKNGLKSEADIEEGNFKKPEIKSTGHTTKKAETPQEKPVEKVTPEENPRYNKEKTGEYQKSAVSPEIISKVHSLEKNGFKAHAAIKQFLPYYNKDNNKSYDLKDLITDEIVMDIINYIDNIPPLGF